MVREYQIEEYIGQQIKKRRKKLALSQLLLAQKLNVSHQSVQKYEMGETRISVGMLFELAQILGVDVNYFYDGYVADSEDESVKLPMGGDLIGQKERRVANLLLVEDDPEDELLMRDAVALFDSEVKIQSVYDGEVALSYIRNLDINGGVNQVPDIVFLDLNIPKRNGLEVLREIKMDRTINFLPVVMLTNSVNALEMLACYKNHASGYLCKSFDIAVFRKDICATLVYWLESAVVPTRF